MYPIKISAGEIFELIRPAALVASAILSILVLTSALKRLSLFVSLLCAVATFLLPLIAAPLYLSFIIVKRNVNSSRPPVSRRWLISSLYAVLILGAIAIYLKLDSQNVDVHLARANRAKVNYDRSRTIQEYRAALVLEDNAHTHKLLAIELADANQWRDALSEFRLAEHGGEPDDSIHFRLGVVLENLKRKNEALEEYLTYLRSESCKGEPADLRCDEARQKVQKLNGTKS